MACDVYLAEWWTKSTSLSVFCALLLPPCEKEGCIQCSHSRSARLSVCQTVDVSWARKIAVTDGKVRSQTQARAVKELCISLRMALS
jgi:hypothetical protein